MNKNRRKMPRWTRLTRSVMQSTRLWPDATENTAPQAGRPPPAGSRERTNAMQIKLIEIYDTDADHEVGGQDLPYLVTASYEGEYQPVADLIDADESLAAFNIQPAASRLARPGHVEFCTFASDDIIHKFFGAPLPLSRDEEDAQRYWQSAYVRTVGELRATLAGLPDDFPLIHTGHDASGDSKNRLGVHVTTNEWAWTTAEHPEYGRHSGWAMRISGFDLYNWNQIVSGSWKDLQLADVNGSR